MAGRMYKDFKMESIYKDQFLKYYCTDSKDRPTQKCQKMLSTKGNLIQHLNDVHSDLRPFPCLICKKLFKRKSDMRTHFRIHTNEKPYSCKICEKEFRQSYHLTIHERIHTGEKPFQCNYCNKEFANKSNLNRHFKTYGDLCVLIGDTQKFIKAIVKQFNCVKCGKLFSKRGNLNRHLKIHDNLKNPNH